MTKVNELKASVSRRNNKCLNLTSAKTVDKITGNVVKTDYDCFTLDKVNEFTTITKMLTYSDCITKEENYYFIKVNGCLRLVSEQAFKLIKEAVLNSKKIVKDENIPVNATLGEDYINKFYKYQEQF